MASSGNNASAPPGLYKAGTKKRKISLKKVQDDLANLVALEKQETTGNRTSISKKTVPERKLSLYDDENRSKNRTQKRRSYIAITKEPLENRLSTLLDGTKFQIIVFICTVIALFGVDFVQAFLEPNPHDAIVGWLSLAILLLFTVELVLASLAKPGYMFSFYFWLDLVGALSLLPDIHLFWADTITESAESSEQLAILRAGRIVRTGTRTTRALRLVRLVRLARVLRLFRIIKFFRAVTIRNEMREKKSSDDRHSSKLGIRLADLLGKRVILGTILLLLILPNLEVVEVDSTPLTGIEMLEHAVNSSLAVKNATVMETPLSNSTVSAYVGTEFSVRFGNGTLLATNRNFEFVMGLSGVAGVLRTFLSHFENAYDNPTRFLVVTGLEILPYDLSSISQIRTDALEGAVSNSGLSFVLYDRTNILKEQALLNMMLTITLIALMGSSAYLFNIDVKTYVVTPIQRTTAVIRKLATTLFLLSSEEETEADSNVLESTFVDSIVEQLNNFFKVGEDSEHPKSHQVAPVPENISRTDLGSHITQDIRDLIPNQRVTCLDTLEALFADKQALQFFKVFLTSEFAVESLTFVLACDQYKNHWKSMESLIADIIRKYIAEDAKFQINISAIQRHEIITNSPMINENLFETARVEIFNQLRRDNFLRFKNSKLAQQLIDQKKTALKEYKMLKESQEEERIAKLKEKEGSKAIEIVKHFAARLLMQRLSYRPTQYVPPPAANSQLPTQKESSIRDSTTFDTPSMRSIVQSEKHVSGKDPLGRVSLLHQKGSQEIMASGEADAQKGRQSKFPSTKTLDECDERKLSAKSNSSASNTSKAYNSMRMSIEDIETDEMLN